MLKSILTIDGAVIIGSWFFAITIIILGIVFKWIPKKWWLQPYIIGSVGAAAILLMYAKLGSKTLSTSFFLNIIKDKTPIVVLILSFAYLAISLDYSGFFEYCAQIIVRKSNGSGKALFVNLFILVSALTFFTSNDIVILTMTPIVIYVGRKACIKNMVPYLLSQFFAANILSMGLYIGSPTNIVIGDAVEWTFMEYASWMILPAFVSGACALGILYFTFRYLGNNRIAPQYQELLFQKKMTFSKEMQLKVLIFFFLLLILSLTSINRFRLEIWKVCLFFALLTIITDFILLTSKKKRKSVFFSKVSERIPWGIVPFVFSFFFLTAGLSKLGIPKYVGSGLLNLIESLGNNNFFLKTFLGTIMFGEVSALFVNIMNDIPTTVFFAEILTNLSIEQPALYNSIITGTLVGVNPGCNMTIIGALAGLMWISILQKTKSSDEKLPTVKDLTLYGLPIMILVIAVGCIVAWMQVILIFY